MDNDADDLDLPPVDWLPHVKVHVPTCWIVSHSMPCLATIWVSPYLDKSETWSPRKEICRRDLLATIFYQSDHCHNNDRYSSTKFFFQDPSSKLSNPISQKWENLFRARMGLRIIKLASSHTWPTSTHLHISLTLRISQPFLPIYLSIDLFCFFL